jgi:pimeloyl-ACP methyl ester carboxylesterase
VQQQVRIDQIPQGVELAITHPKENAVILYIILLTASKCARAIHCGIRGSKLIKFEKGAHVPMWENRVQFMEIVRDFLDGVKARQ